MKLYMKELKSNYGVQEELWAEIKGDPELLSNIPGGFAGLIRVKVTIKNEGHYFVGKGEVWAPLELECIRCLRPSEYLAHGLWDMILVESARKADFTDQEDVVFIDNDWADISSVIEEVIVSELPFRFLCSEKCLGICPECGQDLNENECRCNNEKVDLRWEKLKDLNLD